MTSIIKSAVWGALIGDLIGNSEVRTDMMQAVESSKGLSKHSIMSAALADWYMNCGQQESLADYYRRWLKEIFSTPEFELALVENSFLAPKRKDYEAVLRVAPFVILGKRGGRVLELVEAACLPTHQSQEAISAAQAIALACSLSDAIRYPDAILAAVSNQCNLALEGRIEDHLEICRNSVDARDVARLALKLFSESSSFDLLFDQSSEHGAELPNGLFIMLGMLEGQRWGVPIELIEKARKMIPEVMPLKGDKLLSVFGELHSV